MIDIKKLVRKKKEDITKFRHDLHCIPETAFTEKKTASYTRPILNKKKSLCKCVLQCGEDIAFYLEKSKGCNYLLGIGREGNDPLNASKLDFNEDVRLLGV